MLGRIVWCSSATTALRIPTCDGRSSLGMAQVWLHRAYEHALSAEIIGHLLGPPAGLLRQYITCAMALKNASVVGVGLWNQRFVSDRGRYLRLGTVQ